MEIIKNMLDPKKYPLKSPYTMKAELIVVHNTANDASAQDEIAYMIRNDNDVSFHYAIDDKEIVQGIPEDRNAWHSGDGKYGTGNRRGIAIEICYSESGGDRFIKAEKLAAKFIASKLKEKGWGINKVMKHQDFNGKYCPHRTLDMGWNRFLDMIQAEMEEKQEGMIEVKVSVLKKGAKGDQVKALQALLIGYGYKMKDGYGNEYGADGSFGGATDRAVREYQKAEGLEVDGSVGSATWNRLLGNK